MTQDIKERVEALDKLRTQGSYSANYHDEPANNGDDDEYNYDYTITSEAGDYILRSIPDYQTTNWETIQFLALAPQMAALIKEFTEREAKLVDAANNLLETIEAYELEDEIDAGEDDFGAVKVLRAILQSLGLQE